MIHNDVMRSVRFMLKVDDAAIAAMIALGGGAASVDDVRAFLKREDEPGYRLVDDALMGRFLDGLILHRRGKDENAPPRPPEPSASNNAVLKKLRVAFELKEDDLVALLTEVGFEVSRPELSALFRKEGHKNFRPCGDQFLRNFLKGLTERVRGPS